MARWRRQSNRRRQQRRGANGWVTPDAQRQLLDVGSCRRVYRREKVRAMHRLREVSDGAREQAALARCDVGVGGQDDRWNLDALLDQRLLKLQAVHSGHLHVEDEAVRQLISQRVEELLSRPERSCDPGACAEQPFHCPEERQIIVDNGNQT